jgi:glycosyltransferase involved in cell wall biosynthesis
VRFVYFAPSDIQVARVDRQCIVNFCDALQQIGVDVELVTIGITLAEGETRARNPLDLYRIRRHFPVRTIDVPVHQKSSDWWIGLNRFIVHSWRGLREALAARRDRTTVLYAKNYGPLLSLLAARALGRGRVRVVYEPHVPPPTALHAMLLRACDRVAANTHALAAELVEHHGLDRARVIGTHQGVDVELYDDLRLSAEDARIRLGLPIDKRLVVYTGKVAWEYAEVNYIVESARRLRARDDIHYVIVGGGKEHVDRFRALVESEGLTNVTLTGFVAPRQVQEYQLAADVLILYYGSGFAINRFRSPGKLFEYMAAHRAIIAVDLPVLREVVGDGDECAALLIEQDNPERLADAIVHVLDDDDLRGSLAERAYARVGAFTWRSRAESIVRFIEPTVTLQSSTSVRREEPVSRIAAHE